MSDLDVITPAETVAVFEGREVHISPLKVGQLSAFARAIQPIGGAVESMASGKTPDLAMVMDLLGNHGDTVVEAISIATGIPVEELSNTTPDQLIDLAVVAIKVNVDFFKGRLTPALLAAVKKAAPGVGPTA